MIPERFRAKCEFCSQELDVRAEGSHQRISGWAKVRTGGGAHGVSLPERQNRWAHSWCIDRATRGTLTQQSLFAEPQR
jgi:hypothetical protein